MIKSESQPNRSRPESEKAYDALHSAIVRCELQPGLWVKASALSDMLGVGRTPTVQALMRLESAGFTRPVKRKGWQVTPVTLQSVHDIFEAFRLVAPGLIMLACRNATDAELRRLHDLTVAWAPGTTRPAAARDSHAQPITYLVEICGNPVIADMGRGVSAHFERVGNFGLQQGKFVDEAYTHWRDETLDALAVRDDRRAREAISKLIEVSESELNRILKDARSIRRIPIEIEPDS